VKHKWILRDVEHGKNTYLEDWFELEALISTSNLKERKEMARKLRQAFHENKNKEQHNV
jgi:hypothetical protein